MGKKKRGNIPKRKDASGSLVSSTWRIVAVAALIICGILIWKLGFSPVRETTAGRSVIRPVTVNPKSFDSKFYAVITQFRCACNGCEDSLVECDCDMPRGAKTEKDFVREKLGQGLTVDEVVHALNGLYGNRIT